MSRATVRQEAGVAAPAEEVWSVVTDWPRQGEWIPLTTVQITAGDGRGVGSRLAAWTGVGRLGFLDTMVITHWDPPHVCEVLHTGRVVRGEGGFEVHPIDGATSRVVWWESVELPMGYVGVLGWRLAKPLVQVGTRRALDRLRGLAG